MSFVGKAGGVVPTPADGRRGETGYGEVRNMAIVYQKSKGLTDAELHYCPGCTHGIIHKLVAETPGGNGRFGQHRGRGSGGLLRLCL